MTEWPRIHVVEGLPEDEVLVYSPPSPGSYPGDGLRKAHPDWVPLQRRVAKIQIGPSPDLSESTP